jgi:hypothetical protein
MGKWLVIVGAGAVVAFVTLRPVAPSPRMGSFADVQRKLGGTPSGIDDLPPSLLRPKDPNGCIYPPLVPTAKLVLVSAERGQAVSSATIASQDVAITSAILTVEPGTEPLYLIAASSQPVIWRVEGAVARIRHMVLASQHPQPGYQRSPPLVGVTGLSRDQVTILSYADCLDAIGSTALSTAQRTVGTIHARVGRDPDIFVAGESVSHVSVPSGTMAVTNPYAGQGGLGGLPLKLLWATGMSAPSFLFRSDLARDLRRAYPDGVAHIDPSNVVASAPVRSYDVLPSYAGLKQLADQGALQETDSGEFRILRKIRMPGDTVFGTFLLAKGVPLPDGDTSQICLVSEETGHPLPDGQGRNPRC